MVRRDGDCLVRMIEQFVLVHLRECLLSLQDRIWFLEECLVSLEGHLLSLYQALKGCLMESLKLVMRGMRWHLSRNLSRPHSLLLHYRSL